MPLTSIAFVGGLALLMPLYYALPMKTRWPLLLLASLGFYAFAGWRGLCYVLFTVISTWLIAWRIDTMQARQKAYVAEHRAELSREERKAYNAVQKRAQRRWLILGLAVNLGIMAFMIVLKSTSLKGTLEDALRFEILIPLGISYYTFRIMGYLIDVYWGKVRAQKNPAKLTLFTIFFPQVWMGPISRYEYLSETLLAPRKFDWDSFQSGAQRMIFGYFKKLVIAERLIGPALRDLPKLDGISALLNMVVYAAALYCDFTGGIDIAIGIGECFGIKMEENFDSPFRSKNIFEYWRRWHITMGTWFRDYVFYPVSVAKPLQKLTAKIKQKHPKLARRAPVYIATMVTWFVTGIWHGAAWNYIAWGLANGVVILISQELQPLYGKFHTRFPKMNGKAYDAFQIARTFLLMAFIRAFDIYLDVPLTFSRFASIFIRPHFGALSEALQVLPWLDWLVAGLGICLLLIGTKRLRRLPAAFWLLLVLAILVFGVYGLGYDASAFVYTRF
ncbi:MAG: MBOAT family protein [Oscillospiraceae bacterium]|nr:MBOAT family protein [Oscillospiraceae bacterium]